MKEGLIKNFDTSDDTSDNDSIEVSIVLEIKTAENNVVEKLSMKFNKNINIRDMIKEIIPNFNEVLQNSDKKIYLNPESNDYQLCECKVENEDGEETYTNGEILDKTLKLKKVQKTNFKILYSSKDILLNFKKKTVCNLCMII